MHERLVTILTRAMLLAMIAAGAALAGCARTSTPVPTTFAWVLGGSEPAFDPHGPPDARRWALERLLTRGLLAEDSLGRVMPAAAESIFASSDSLTWTFRLRRGLQFIDGGPCRSGDFARALTAGLTRRDHGTQAWVLAAVSGVDAMRPGRSLPALGIDTPDDRTLVLRLNRPDPLLLRKLAVPGVCDAWSERGDSTWMGAIGLGPLRAIEHQPGRRMRLVAAGTGAPSPAFADTVFIRFALTAGRARTLLRNGAVDLVWPLPQGMLDEALPGAYRTRTQNARPRRQMVLVMRADLPPTTRLPARRALAHGINRDDVVRMLGPGAERRTEWLANAPPAEFPKLDGAEILMWMDRGKLGRSFHVDLAYRGDGPGAAIARSMQGEWSGHAIYIEPHPLRGERFADEALGGRMHLVLAESQALIDHVSAELAQMVMPIRGPAVGAYRSGWRTREFDPWIHPRAAEIAPIEFIERRLAEELVVLPLADLPWVWIEREAGPGGMAHPHFGPQCGRPVAARP